MEQSNDAKMSIDAVNGDNTTTNPFEKPAEASEQQVVAQDEKAKEDQDEESKSTRATSPSNADSFKALFQIVVKLPHKPYEMPITVSTREQVQDLRQSIIEHPDTYQYSCFHLEHNGVRINDFVELSDVKGLTSGKEVKLVEDPYTEKEARMHTIRVRDLIGAAGDRIDTLHGILAGVSIVDKFTSLGGGSSSVPTGKPQKTAELESPNALTDYDFDAPVSVQTILPASAEQTPKTVKSICVSLWNPPPYHLRQKGHLMYLQLTTNEGEQFQITSHVSGFYVNRSSNSKFDPFPRAAPKGASAHSLLSLIEKVSPSFNTSFVALQHYNNQKDPLANFQVTSSIPANPWLIPTNELAPATHQPDITRTQEAYLLQGAENADTLRDWNEELQSTRELPRETVQDRVFRERLMQKLFSEYNDAAARGAIMVARGEVAPLNPTEDKYAQIFVYNNVFFSYGSDGVGTFTTEGGDEAARVAVGKDVAGVKIINQLDIEGIFTPGTLVIDYLGKRLVGQSIVPGIFKQREPGEHQIDYGGVEGRDVVADNEAFVPAFSKLSKALRVKRHDVWDKEGKAHTLEGSVETKGLLGTDGRKYVLDLYRLTPLDITWLEEHWRDGPSEQPKPLENNYPHRMTILRPELVEAYWRFKMADFVKAEIERRKSTATTAARRSDTSTNGTALEIVESANANDDTEKSATSKDDQAAANGQPERVDISSFDLTFNPDVFCGQNPPSEEEKAKLAKDEEDVRSVCSHLHQVVIPELIRDLSEGDIGFPMDGQSLGRLMHKRGINMRYLGKIATHAKEQKSRLEALQGLAVQEMIARSFKHVANRYLKNLPAIFATNCLSHLLNCLLGADLNAKPPVHLDEDVQSMYLDGDWSFKNVSVESLREQIQDQIHLRYRYTVESGWYSRLKSLQLLREVCLKLGLQLVAKDYQFSPKPVPHVNGVTNGTTNGVNHLPSGLTSKKKKKNGDQASQSSESLLLDPPTTFSPDDILNVVPIVKDSCPRSDIAEETLEAARVSLMQNQRELGQELLLESLSLHEQIYGILHPEVARVYHQLSMLYYQLEEKNAAVELARKAVIVFERTLGLDSNETILSYQNLGLFEHANGNTKLALWYMKHALELWKIIYGLKHPDSITTINNAAVMLQNLKQYHESRIWFEKSLAISEEVSGKTSVNTATLCFQLAQALALDQEAKAAVNRMREAYSIFLAKLGKDDRNTKESESWLEQLTQNAVSIAKHAKDVQARRLRRVHLTPQMGTGMRPLRQVGQGSAEGTLGRSGRGSREIDERSVEELIRFIEGGGDTSKRGGVGAGARRNPKRRGGSKTSGSAS